MPLSPLFQAPATRRRHPSPQVVCRATNWQENWTALTPLSILINGVRRGSITVTCRPSC